MLAPTFCGGPKDFTQTGCDEDCAEDFLKPGVIHSCGKTGTDPGGDAAGQGRGEDISPLEFALLFSEGDGHGGPGEKEEQIDAPGGDGVHAQHGGQPYHQQASAAHPKACEKSQGGSDDDGDDQVIQDTEALPI